MNYNLKIDFLSNVKTDSQPAKGKILISEPFSQDLYFHRSVVILTEHSSESSTGFVINKCVNINKSTLINDFPDIEPTVSIGGPVSSTSLFYIHNKGSIIRNSIKIAGDIYFSGDWKDIKEALTSGIMNENHIRFYIGYSGWSKNQLQSEIENKLWVVDDINPKIIFEDTTNIWERLVKSKGNDFKLWLNIPHDPIDN